MTNKTTGKAIAKEKPLSQEAVAEISDALRQLLADVFCLYLKTKSFHWHMTGRHFHDYHVLLDEHAQQVFAMTDDIAERARKIGGTTVRSVGDISRRQRLKDNDAESLTAHDRLSELRDDNLILSGFLRHAHETCAKFYDVATTSLIEVWIDQAERRTWFRRRLPARLRLREKSLGRCSRERSYDVGNPEDQRSPVEHYFAKAV